MNATQQAAMSRAGETGELVFGRTDTQPLATACTGVGDAAQEFMFMVYEYAAISEGITRAEGEARRTQLAAMREKAKTIRAALTKNSEATP